MLELQAVREEIERVKRDALSALVAVNLPEHRYLLAERRIVAICLASLRVLDEARGALRSYVKHQAGSDPEQQAYLQENAGYFLIQEIEHQIQAIVSEAIREVREEVANHQPVRERVVIERVAAQPAWRQWLAAHEQEARVFWGGLVAVFLLAWVVFSSFYAGGLAAMGTFLFCRTKPRWVMLPLSLLLLAGLVGEF